MEKYLKIFVSFLIISLSFPSKYIGQNFSESDIKLLAKQVSAKLKGLNLGNGVTARGCYSIGRTLIYMYDVSDYWYPPENIKEEIISNMKTAGAAKMYFINDINSSFYYYKGSKLIKKVTIKSYEFSENSYKTGSYISLKGHPKAKGVNIKLKKPVGWDVLEGDRPNIVKKFVKDGNTYLVLIKDNNTFYSKKQSRELFEDEEFSKDFINECLGYFKNAKVSNKSVVSIDSYPALSFEIEGDMEQLGIKFSAKMKLWWILYEDKMILLQCMGLNNAEYKLLNKLFFSITNSVIFPDQYD